MQNIFPAEAFQQQERYLCAVLLFPLSLSLVLFCFISPILKANFFSGKQSFCNQHWDDQLIVVLASCFPLENVLTWMFLKPHRNVFKGTENYLRKSWFSLWSAVVSSFHTICRHSSQALWLLPGHQETAHVLSLHPQRCQTWGRFAEPIIWGSVLKSAYFLSVVWIHICQFVVLVPLTSSQKSPIKNINVIKARLS